MVLQLAQERGLAEPYTEAMFSAFSHQDRDIGHDAVILDVATSVGLDGAEVEEALQNEERGGRQRADQEYAVRTVGIDSAPGIVVEGRVLRGVPSATRLKKVVNDLAERGTSSSAGQS